MKTAASTYTAGLDPHELRHALLFWDKLVWPMNNIVRVGADQDIEFLETSKILERPPYTVYL
jgi:hypothetical protein